MGPPAPTTAPGSPGGAPTPDPDLAGAAHVPGLTNRHLLSTAPSTAGGLSAHTKCMNTIDVTPPPIEGKPLRRSAVLYAIPTGISSMLPRCHSRSEHDRLLPLGRK